MIVTAELLSSPAFTSLNSSKIKQSYSDTLSHHGTDEYSVCNMKCLLVTLSIFNAVLLLMLYPVISSLLLVLRPSKTITKILL